MLAGPAGTGRRRPPADRPLARLTSELGADRTRPARLAVRSSGVAEDGAGASFAGLHDTELGLTRRRRRAGRPPLLGVAVERLARSAIGTRRGLPLDGGAMAVVVQALVPAEAAAVVFTRHPVTGRTDQILVNAAPRPRRGDGLGHRDARHDRRRQGHAARSSSSRPASQPAGRRFATTRSTSSSDLCLAVERAFGAAVDIEAALRAPTAGTSSRPARSPP